ncbi:MAG: hypothetical protein K0S65_4372, partial [Labilithrix sp.]|nr:hypothetical protein [Labilithrix sp.]
SPVGSGFEPLGALRRAFARSVGREINPLLLEVGGTLDALLAGNGIALEEASRLVTAFLWPKQSGTNSLLVIDDAKAVDPATLEVCVRAVRQNPAFGIIARLDATSGLPSVLASLPKAAEYELPLLSREGAENIAMGCTGGALDALARRRWARLGGGNALAIVEAITLGVASGDITWSGDIASPRSRAAGRGALKPAAKWIRLRANAESTPARVLLSLLAVVGGEARVSFLVRALERAGLRMDVIGTLSQLERSRWIVAQEPAAASTDDRFGTLSERTVAFRSRSHHKALFSTLEDDARKKLHLAIAGVLEEEEGAFGRVEAAWHAAQAGEGARAAKVLLEAARSTADAHLEASTTQLIAFARRAYPACEEEALELLASALARAPSVAPPPVSTAPVTTPSAPPSTAHASVPPNGPARIAAIASVSPTRHKASVPPPPPPADDVASDEPDSMVEHARIVPAAGKLLVSERLLELVAEEDAPESEPATAVTATAAEGTTSPPSSNTPGSQIAVKLGELAKDALLAADNVALERWVDGLRATGESPEFTERMGAMARLGRGDIGDALRVLRRTRGKLAPNDHRRRCQTSLALGVALSAAGRPQEALLEGMDALARARQIDDERGAKACLAFLAKLYTSVSRDVEAERLRASST